MSIEESIEKFNKIMDNDLSITHGVYEPPNNIPILRYKHFKENYKVIVIDDSKLGKSCIRWLKTEGIIPYKILSSINEIKNLPNDKYFVVLTNDSHKTVSYNKMLLKEMKNKNIEYSLCPYDYEKIVKHDYNYINYLEKNKKNIETMLNLLYDDESRETYVEYIRSIMNYDFYRLTQHPTWNKYFDSNVFLKLENECVVNCGSSNGDTLFYFLENYEKFYKYFALESDEKRVLECRCNINLLPLNISSKISIIDSEINSSNSIDNLINEEVTIINMDVEGMELDIIKGAIKTIKKHKPVIACCAYHLPSDLYELPMFIKNISDDYEIIYRKYASTTRNRFTNAELVMYAVPKNRLKNPV